MAVTMATMVYILCTNFNLYL